jgi:hypothetical protein
VRLAAPQRPFGFVSDPSVPGPGVVSFSYAFGIGSGIAADRPLPVHLATAGGSHTLGFAAGVGAGVAPFVTATFAENPGDPGRIGGVVTAGAAWRLTGARAPLQFSLTGAGFHEGLSGANGLMLLAAGSADVDRWHLAANVRADKAFAAGRDDVDLLALAGVSYRLTGLLRVGLEYVGQDLEGIVGDEAEGGPRQAAGPSVALDLGGGRYQVALASAFGLTAASPRALLRAALSASF